MASGSRRAHARATSPQTGDVSYGGNFSVLQSKKFPISPFGRPEQSASGAHVTTETGEIGTPRRVLVTAVSAAGRGPRTGQGRRRFPVLPGRTGRSGSNGRPR